MKKLILTTSLLIFSFSFLLFSYNFNKNQKYFSTSNSISNPYNLSNNLISSPCNQGEQDSEACLRVKKTNSNFNFPPLTLESIFNSDHSWTATISAKSKIELLATGDVIPARSVNFQNHQHNDFTWSWHHVADFLKSSDLTIINLEAPLLKNCPITNEGMIFCGDGRHIYGLKLADIDIANIANNHYTNHGQIGIEESNQLLVDNGIDITGDNSILYKTIKNTTLAFLSYNEIEHINDSLGKIDEIQIEKDIKEAKSKADLIIVSYHWGAEYQAQPEQYRIDLAHSTIDWGADLIIGNHPHWIQPVEIYKGKIINYALGNFIFDQEWSPETKQGIIAKYTIFNKKIIDLEFTPVFLHSYGQTDIATDPLKTQILKNLYHQSLILKNKLINL